MLLETRSRKFVRRLIEGLGRPRSVVMDNGLEFTSRALDAWVCERSIQLDFVRPGKPIENRLVESFNGKFRDECLSQHWLTSLIDARYEIETWRRDYNRFGSHSSLGQLLPAVFAQGAERRSLGAIAVAPRIPAQGRGEDPV